MNETIVTLSLVAVAAYFSVLIVRGLAGYARFLRVRARALVTWPGQRPANFSLLILLGAIAAVSALLNTYLNHPFHKVYSQISIALYFIGILPLLARIPMGFYGDGIWAEGGFVPYNRIRRLAFREGPDLVLLLLPWGGGTALKLRVPPAEYGAVRKVLGDKIRAHVVNLEGSILGL